MSVLEAPKPVTKAEAKPAKKWSMAVVNFMLDAALFVNIIIVMWVSIILKVIFPPPTYSQGWSLWGLNYNQWHDLQFYALCVFAVLAIEHVALHWNWVCCVAATQVLKVNGKPDEGSQAVYGVGTFIGILVAIMASLIAAVFTVVRPL